MTEVTMRRQHHQRLTIALMSVVALLSSACGPSEDDLKGEVRARLAGNQTTAPLALSVEVKKRTVYVSGKTATKEEQQVAVDLARGVDRVQDVVNDMWINNATLADKVKAALASDPVVGKLGINVDAQGSLVRLWSDQTNREERARAVQIASAVEGVGQVEDRMK
jgi:osmotically-inducible protein OsmY